MKSVDNTLAVLFLVGVVGTIVGLITISHTAGLIGGGVIVSSLAALARYQIEETPTDVEEKDEVAE